MLDSRTTTSVQVPSGVVQRDSYEVHQAALRHGFDVALYPRQILLARRGSARDALSFVHGVPQTSALSAVTYAQDKRMRRELLLRAGLSVPEGRVFAIRNARKAVRFAEEFGYPIVIKPAVGDNLNPPFTGIHNEDDIDAAISSFKVLDIERPDFVRAAYGLTFLAAPEEQEDGRIVAPSSYQLLVERQVPGEYIRLLVLHGEVISAVHCPGGPANLSAVPGCADVADEVHPTVKELAIRAYDAVPNLALAAVDVVLADHRRPASSQEAWIVEFAERPWLAVQAAVSDHLSQQTGASIFVRSALLAGLDLGGPSEWVSVSFDVEGATKSDGVVDAMLAAAERSNVTATASVSDHIEGTVSGTMVGGPGSIAAILESLVDGTLDGERAMLVEARAIETTSD